MKTIISLNGGILLNARWIMPASVLMLLSLLLKIGIDDLRSEPSKTHFSSSFQAQNELVLHVARLASEGELADDALQRLRR